jgi:hypothetical protein
VNANPKMPDLKDIIVDLAWNRARYIDELIDRRMAYRGYDEPTDEERDKWTAEAVKQWREKYPSLQALWAYHEAQQREAKVSR